MKVPPAGASSVSKEETLFSMAASEPVATASVPPSAPLAGDVLIPTPAASAVSDLGKSTNFPSKLNLQMLLLF